MEVTEEETKSVHYFLPLRSCNFMVLLLRSKVVVPTGGQGTSLFACADVTNQLLSCWVDPHICLDKNTDTAIVGDRWTGMGGHHALYC